MPRLGSTGRGQPEGFDLGCFEPTNEAPGDRGRLGLVRSLASLIAASVSVDSGGWVVGGHMALIPPSVSADANELTLPGLRVLLADGSDRGRLFAASISAAPASDRIVLVSRKRWKWRQ